MNSWGGNCTPLRIRSANKRVATANSWSVELQTPGSKGCKQTEGRLQITGEQNSRWTDAPSCVCRGWPALPHQPQTPSARSPSPHTHTHTHTHTHPPFSMQSGLRLHRRPLVRTQIRCTSDHLGDFFLPTLLLSQASHPLSVTWRVPVWCPAHPSDPSSCVTLLEG